mmetsp:Transcript_28072/g.97137  ORF Transcript_28072/g.97137 Transcript_28072/m.97137 type:complete len:208 (+) Transcript_28072:1239-1862(+)
MADAAKGSTLPCCHRPGERRRSGRRVLRALRRELRRWWPSDSGPRPSHRRRLPGLERAHQDGLRLPDASACRAEAGGRRWQLAAQHHGAAQQRVRDQRAARAARHRPGAGHDVHDHGPAERHTDQRVVHDACRRRCRRVAADGGAESGGAAGRRRRVVRGERGLRLGRVRLRPGRQRVRRGRRPVRQPARRQGQVDQPRQQELPRHE